LILTILKKVVINANNRLLTAPSFGLITSPFLFDFTPIHRALLAASEGVITKEGEQNLSVLSLIVLEVSSSLITDTSSVLE
jgi:hypothetical protein